jgi:tetratricopeptide (TPR) repeat protein
MTLTRTAALLVLLFIATDVVIAQDLVTRARELYATANYEDALEALDAIEAEAHTVSDRQAVREYRALCQIALGRLKDAVETIEQMIDADPFYRPAAEHRPPRLIALFDQVRRRRLPELGRKTYVGATIAFDEHRNADASDAFALVLRLIAEAEAGSRGAPPDEELNNLKGFATRFLELVRMRDQRTQVSTQSARDAFDGTDTDVTPPVPIRQDIPPWESVTLGSPPFEGKLEVIIDAAGDVRETRLTVPIHPDYDAVILDFARKWKYRPAMKNGRPVTYRTVITMSLTPQRRLRTGP